MADMIFIVQELAASEDDTDISDVVAARLNSISTAVLTASSIVISEGLLRDKKVRVANYVTSVLPRYSVDDFKARFRLSRDTFDQFVLNMAPHMSVTVTRHKISIEKKLLVFVKYVATQLYYQALADMFGICETTVHDIVHDVSRLVSSKLLQLVVKWPSGRSLKDIEHGFEEMQGFPGVIGAIDGSHIPIKTPKECPENYFNRKGFPSMILQAVCDNNMNFIDVYCGWPGSVHDARVLRNSDLSMKAETDTERMFPSNTHLLGDAAYPMSPWLLVPFKDFGNLNKAQKEYNYKHSSSRMVIERAFGVLKGRFRRLKYIDLMDCQTIVFIILSCCTLHQLCLATFEDINEYVEEGTADMETVNCCDDVMRKSESGLRKRNAILQLFQ